MAGPIIVFILHNLLLLYLWSRYRRGDDHIQGSTYLVLFVFFLFLAIYGLQTGDYLHQIEHIYDVYSDLRRANNISESLRDYHMEPIYNYLAVWLHGNNVLWRGVVFGFSIIIIFYYVRKIGLDFWSYFFLFTLISLSGFIVGRMYWGVALFFCSVAYARKTGNPLYFIISLLSVFAHKCLYVFPLFLPLAFIKLNRKNVLLIGGAFLVMIIAIRFAFGNIVWFDSYLNGFSHSIEHYTDSDRDGSVFGRSLGERIIYATEFLATLILIIAALNRTIKYRLKLPNYIQSQLSLSVAFLLFAIAFIIGDFDDGTFAWRYITISWFPLVFVLTYFRKKRLISNSIWSISIALLLMSFEASLTIPIFYASFQ